MQNSNLSSKIFPIVKEDWERFIKKVEKDLQQMNTNYNNDKRRIKELERYINRLKEITSQTKDNIFEILNYKELFMYIDNSLEKSFDALKYFKDKGDLDNNAVRIIYERIVTSPEIIKLTSEYSSLSIRVPFDSDRIKKMEGLQRGSEVDYDLIKELLRKYKFDDVKKKNILFYPVIMTSIKQNEVKETKVHLEEKKEDNRKFYLERFKEITKLYQEKKDSVKDLLVKCFSIREKMDPREVDMYSSFASNPGELNGYNFTDEIKFKIYTLAFFKIKKDIENYIDGISDMILDEKFMDDEIVFFNEMIIEFDQIANKLKSLNRDDKTNGNETANNVFFALDAFNRVIMRDLLIDKNMNNIKALLQKIESVSNSKIDGVKTNHMLGVEEEEVSLGKNISMLTTSKMKLAYIMVNKNVLILGGSDSNDKLSRITRLIVNKNLYAIRRQIELIEKEDERYIELQKEIISDIVGDKEEAKEL